jgi:hypothetical protein
MQNPVQQEGLIVLRWLIVLLNVQPDQADHKKGNPEKGTIGHLMQQRPVLGWGNEEPLI